MLLKILKKWHFIIFFMGFLSSAQNSDRINYNQAPPVQINANFFNKCCKQAQELHAMLLEAIHNFSQDVEYWKMQKLAPFGYFISKSPINWLSEKSQNQELDEKINFLNNGIEKYAFYVGKIHYFLAQNYQEKTPQEIEQSMQELLTLIAECVAPTTIQENSSHFALFAANQKHMATFKPRIEEIFYPGKRPNHFGRNWLAYSALGVSAAVLALYAYNNQEHIKKWYTKMKIAIHNYPQNYIYNPFNNVVETLTDTSEKSMIEREARNEAIRTYYERQNNDQQKSLLTRVATNISDFLFNRSKSDQRKSPEEIQQIINNAEKGDISAIIKEKNTQLQTPVQGLFFGDVIRLFGMELQQLKTQGTEMGEKIELIIALLALTPTLILGKISYNTFKDIINYCKKKNTTSLKKNIRSMHRTLHSYTNQATLSFKDQGLLLYWVTEIKKAVNTINGEERSLFIEDIDDVLKLTTSLEEKKAIIQRLYTSYECLHVKAQ